ncbi:MAG: purine-nucleoside phosphorylase [Saprospiraceae bacterium]
MSSSTTFDNIQDSAIYIKKKLGKSIPKTAIIMGTGLSDIVDLLTDKIEVPYSEIPYFPNSTVTSHRGRLVVGKLIGTSVLILAGRWHYYEGYSTKELTLPIRVLKAIGVKTVLFTNVSGAVNASYNAGDLVLITDHINLIPDHPLRGENDDRLGVRFPDMMNTYNNELRAKVTEHAANMGILIHEGVYLALQGPSLETPAEYGFIHRVGADLVGMSTVPEVIVAKHAGMTIGAISIVSNVCYPPERLTETTVEEVIEVAKKGAVNLNKLIGSLISQL